MPDAYEEKKSKLQRLMDMARKDPSRLTNTGDKLLLQVLEEMNARIEAQDSAIGGLNARTMGSMRIG